MNRNIYSFAKRLASALFSPARSTPSVKIFSIALAPPKPFHEDILRNWATLPKNFRISLVTDCPEKWLPLIPENSNIDTIDISIPEWFSKIEHSLEGYPGAEGFKELVEKKFAGAVNGWTACSLRPLIPQIYSVKEYDIWGWIDWDVMINTRLLPDYLVNTRKAEIFMFPEAGYMWEHFKLWRTNIDLRDLILSLLVNGQAGPTAPLCAMISYAIGSKRIKRDGLSQKKIAVHWAYTDRLKAENGFPVRQNKNGALQNLNGEDVMFFVADSQVKDWQSDAVFAYREAMKDAGTYTFNYFPKE